MLNKLFVFGDSIVYGKWDKMGGWASRVRSRIDGRFNLTGKNNIQVYNLVIPLPHPSGASTWRHSASNQALLRSALNIIKENLVGR